MLAFATRCLAEIIIGGGVQSHSPDFKRVEVNGVFLPGQAESGWWYYDWGDGSQSTGYFPVYHRFQVPGDYTIRVVGFNDLGERAESSFSHPVPAPAPTEVARVFLAKTFLGLGEGQTRSILLSAYDASGQQLSIDGRTVELFAPIPDVIDVAVDGARIHVTGLTLNDRDTAAAWVYAYVDGVECARPLFVVINRTTTPLVAVEGEHCGFYLPDWFFEQSYVSEQDHALVLDLAYEEFNGSVDLDETRQGSPLVQGVSYVPAVHGANGNPLLMGDSAGPLDGAPRFDILFHETGHNFQAYRMLFLSSGVPAGALYQETLAEWHVQFGCERLLDLHFDELGPPARAAVVAIRDGGRAYHAYELQTYIDNGMVFDFNTIVPSHVLVEKIYELCDAYGWEKLRDFYDYFDTHNMAALSRVYGDFGGSNNVYRLSALVAVLGRTFEQDLRPVFVSLNFPIDDDFHDAIWQAVEPAPVQWDFDHDGDVDDRDFELFQSCANGPAVSYPPGCGSRDLDTDGDIDSSDFGILQRCLSGEGTPADPNCAN